MNMPAVMTKSERPSRIATSRAAPAASLAGMRLWRDPTESIATNPANSDSPRERERTAGSGSVAAALRAAALSSGQAVRPGFSLELDEDASDESTNVEIVDGGLPSHVSTFPQRARDARRQDSDILGYWARITGEREMPVWQDLDQNQIAYFWPNSYLLSCVPSGSRDIPMISRATRIVDDDGMADRSHDIAFTAAMVTWIVKFSLDVVQAAGPLIESRTFTTDAGDALECEVIAMPLGEHGKRIENVLCHVRVC